MKNKITLLNSISALFLQVVTIISGFIIPKIILLYFGSSVNGLVSSISQFLSYIALIEGGVTGVIYASLYKPLLDNDKTKISRILVTSKIFYRRIGYIFMAYSLVLAVIYPLFINKDFDFLFASGLTIVLSITLLIQYMFSLTLKTLLVADKKLYIISFTQVGIIILNIIFTYISARIYPNIHILKFISGIMYVFQPLIYAKYVNKNYDISWSEKQDNTLLKERWNGFAINVANFIHTSTDITILTIFTNLKIVSVYYVYSLVINGLGSLVKSISSGIEPTIGHSYAKNDSNDINFKMDLYEFVIFFLVGFLFTVASIQITPFVMVYTKKINDANYCQPIFGYVIVLAEALYLLKYPHLSIAYTANKFKEITVPAFIEAFINIVISVIIVNKIGLIGVAIGTAIAMLYRMIFQVRYTKKILPNRKPRIYYKKLIIISIATIVAILMCNLIRINEENFVNLILGASIHSLIVLIVYFITAFLFFKREFKFLISYIKLKN
ncbi:MAG: polysaccharide biosynthesis C-terminal domain-containing protein [Anaerococcus vaginalis]|uniref:lipopolysaccharide biosynthesis protein n=1 Tax=Anaerococcus TaxID=165779 RepID=UPI0008A584B3|nr:MULTISPECIES: polysaccharide biosynthesis C-terminal domain-containing protein [Anaerococcus]MDU5086297.1 polysaccharide biosynthesis C-terminal domain-containing protein [Anaerococcus vaginalis]OFL16140.1 virulence factor MviN [Anaerococcus sp. HMSC068A02]